MPRQGRSATVRVSGASQRNRPSSGPTDRPGPPRNRSVRCPDPASSSSSSSSSWRSASAASSLYDQVLRGDSAAALALPRHRQIRRRPRSPAPAPLERGSSAVPAASFDGTVAGTWNVATGSVAGYRVREQLASLSAESDAVGRTDQVTGSITIETSGSTSTLTAASLSVDTTSITSDKPQRDNRLRNEGLQTDTYPTATFKLTKPVEIPAAALAGTASDVTLTGDLTIHGVTKSVDIPAKAQLVNGTIQVAGSIGFPLSDYGDDRAEHRRVHHLDRRQRHARVPGRLHQGLIATGRALPRVGAARVELLADQPQLGVGRGGRRGERRGRPPPPSRSSRGPPRRSRPGGANRGASRPLRRSGRCRGR